RVAAVRGNGVSSALMSPNRQATLRGQSQAHRDADNYNPVRRIVERVNQQITDSMIDSGFITFFSAEFDEPRSTLRYTNAGHNPPLLLRGGRPGGENGEGVRRLGVGGTGVGILWGAGF